MSEAIETAVDSCGYCRLPFKSDERIYSVGLFRHHAQAVCINRLRDELSTQRRQLAALTDGSSVQLPKNANHAEAMLKLGYAWIEANEPGRLKKDDEPHGWAVFDKHGHLKSTVDFEAPGHLRKWATNDGDQILAVRVVPVDSKNWRPE